MKTILTTLMLLIALTATPAMATCDLSNVGDLSESAKATLKLACEQAVHDAAANTVPVIDMTNPETLSQWGTVAQEWAKAIGIAANELGVAADTFLATDAGKMTAAVILYTVMGDQILAVILGVPLLIIVLVVGIRMANQVRITEVTYHETETNWRGKPKVVSVERMPAHDCPGYWIAYGCTVVLSTVVMMNILPG